MGGVVIKTLQTDITVSIIVYAYTQNEEYLFSVCFYVYCVCFFSLYGCGGVRCVYVLLLSKLHLQ